MSTTSADPAKLKAFIDGVKAARRSAETAQASVASLSASTIAACEGYVSVPALGCARHAPRQHGGERALRRRRCTMNCWLPTTTTADRSRSPMPRWRRRLAAKGVGTPPARRSCSTRCRSSGIPQTSGFVDDPICAANGNMIHQDTDLTFPSVAGALNIVRTYNSVVADRDGVFGQGWSSALDAVLDARRRARSSCASTTVRRSRSCPTASTRRERAHGAPTADAATVSN